GRGRHRGGRDVLRGDGSAGLRGRGTEAGPDRGPARPGRRVADRALREGLDRGRRGDCPWRGTRPRPRVRPPRGGGGRAVREPRGRGGVDSVLRRDAAAPARPRESPRAGGDPHGRPNLRKGWTRNRVREPRRPEGAGPRDCGVPGGGDREAAVARGAGREEGPRRAARQAVPERLPPRGAVPRAARGRPEEDVRRLSGGPCPG